MNRKNLILLVIIILGFTIYLGFADSNDNSNQAVQSETVENDTEAVLVSLSSASGNGTIAALSEQTTKSSSTTKAGSGSHIYVVGTDYKCASWSDEKYPIISLFGENYVPLCPNNEKIWDARVNKLARLVLDLPSNGENYTLKTGEKLDLGEGYTLEARQVDVDGQCVWLEFDKDGKYVDDQPVSVDTDLKTWTCTLDNIQGENEIPILKVHVNKAYYFKTDSVVQIDGLWLVDYANTKELKIGDKFTEATLTEINSGVDASNLGSLVFKHNIQNNTQALSSTPMPTPTPTSHLQ